MERNDVDQEIDQALFAAEETLRRAMAGATPAAAEGAPAAAAPQAGQLQRFIESQVEQRLAERLSNIPVLPGPAGDPGKDVPVEVVQELVKEEVSKLPKPKDGKPGKDGSPGKNAQTVHTIIRTPENRGSAVEFTPHSYLTSTNVESAVHELVDDLAASDGASRIGVMQSGTGAVAETVEEALKNGLVNVMSFIPIAQRSGIRARTNTTDLSTYVQLAIDAMEDAGGGAIWCPPGHYYGNVILKSGVYLWGPGQGYLPSGDAKLATFVAAGTGVVIDTPATAVNNVGVIGVNVLGLGSGTAAKGIRFRDVTRGFIKSVNANNFADEGVVISSDSIACVFEDIHPVNCLLDRSQAAKIGAFDIDGSDHHVYRVEATTSQSALSDSNAYLCGIVVRGDNNFFTSCIGEISDEGIHLVSGATLNRFVSCRTDLNFGHGWNVIGTNNRFANCDGINNSQENTDTYDNWNFSGGSNQTVNCMGLSNVAKVVKYGFNDTVSSASTKNRHVNPTSSGAGTAEFLNDNANGSAFAFPEHQHVTFTANTATPSISGQRYFRTANSNPTTITNFTGGVSGQQIEVLCNDDNTTIQHNGSTITLVNAGNKKLRSGVIYKFVKTGSVWREADDFPLGVTADVGDAAKTLQARVNEETQIWATELTEDRAVALSTTGAYAGAKFHIVRTAAGAFNLNVGTGPLKALAEDTWCIVTYNGSAWALTAYGAL